MCSVCILQDGAFGAMMQVGLTNDGPVTITVDSADDPKLHPPPATAPAQHKGKAKAGGGSDGGKRNSGGEPSRRGRGDKPPTSMPPEVEALSPENEQTQAGDISK